MWFQYSVDRKGEHPAAHLKHFVGVLQADAFAGYNALHRADRQPGRIVEAGCWSHAPRKPLHGQQERGHFHAYYDNYCYLPLYVFAGQAL